MFHFLSAEALYGLLLVTTFASVGLLGLWAATSRWHPFLRTTIVLAILSVLLLRPMYEPFVMLVSQVATIAAGVAVYRWVKNRKNADAKRTRFQFSLKTLLFVSTIVALGAAVVAKLPELGFLNWLLIIAAGVLLGLGSLLAAGIISPDRTWKKRTVAASFAIGFNSLALGAPLFASSVYFQMTLMPSSPPSPTYIVAVIVLLAILQTLMQVVGIVLWRAPTILEMRTSKAIETFRCGLINSLKCGFLVALAILPAYITWRLLNPLPPLEKSLASPNAYNDLAALGKHLERTPLQSAYAADPQDPKRLAQEIANHDREYQRLVALLKLPSVVPDPMDLRIDDLGYFRTLARLLSTRADVFAVDGKVDSAIQDNLRIFTLAKAREGGLLTDWLTSTAIEGIGVQGIFASTSRLDAEQCQSIMDQLLKHDSSREAAQAIAYRDTQYGEHFYGWINHLYQLLDELTGNRDEHLRTCLLEPLARIQAQLRLLVAELALRKYQLTHNSLPDRLDQLVPDILPEVPRDPFDPAGGPLRYKKTDGGYLLYSVSLNGVDDGGVPPASILNDSEAIFWWPRNEQGDMRLDLFFAPAEP